MRFMDTPESVTGPLNLGNPAEFSVRELAETVIDLVGSSSRIAHMPLPAPEATRYQPGKGTARLEALGAAPGRAPQDNPLFRGAVRGSALR